MEKNARIAQLKRKEIKFREKGEYLIADELVKMIKSLEKKEG